jgi:hypothetical protein
LAAPPLFVLLDGASAFATLAVAAGFLSVARWSRQALHYLLTAGFTLLATGFLFVSASHFGSGVDANLADVVRIVCQLLGAFVLLAAYADHHLTGKAHVVLALLASVATVVSLGAILYWLVPPAASLPPLPTYFAIAYACMAAAFLGCAFFAGFGWHKRPTWGRAMVPLGFLCWTFSTYTWIFIVLADAGAFLPVVYTWRLAAILLMLWAMVRKPRSPAPRSVDAAP